MMAADGDGVCDGERGHGRGVGTEVRADEAPARLAQPGLPLPAQALRRSIPISAPQAGQLSESTISIAKSTR